MYEILHRCCGYRQINVVNIVWQDKSESSSKFVVMWWDNISTSTGVVVNLIQINSRGWSVDSSAPNLMRASKTYGCRFDNMTMWWSSLLGMCVLVSSSYAQTWCLLWPIHDKHRSPITKHHSGSDQAPPTSRFLHHCPCEVDCRILRWCIFHDQIQRL